MKRTITKGGHLGQFARFVIVGALNTGVDAGLYILLTRFVGLQPLVASMFSFLAGSVNSFFLNKRWTFGHPATTFEALRQYGKFVMVSTVVMGLHQLSLATLHYGLGLSDLIAKGWGIAAGVVAGFLLNKLWVFKWSHRQPLTTRQQPDAVPL